MAHPWQAEHPVDAALARALIAAQFPDVDLTYLTHLGEGWDNDVWRANDLVFRFPRRAVAVPLLETEAKALPSIAPHLPVAIPVPRLIGRASPEFPRLFLGYGLLHGVTGDRAVLSDAERHALAVPLARFLKALHAVSVSTASECGVPPDQFRADAARHAKILADRVPLIAPGLPRETLARIAALSPPLPGAPAPAVVLHGDLYLRHLLFDADRRFHAVIDWGDLCTGEPLVDLAVVYAALPAAARDSFFAIYGNVDESSRARARYAALARYAVTLLAYARDRGDAPLEREARGAIDRVLEP